MSNLIPVGMDRFELADVLADMRRRVEKGDSYEGNITYAMPADPDEFPDGIVPEGFPTGGDFWVHGVYRIGNLMGQGGVRMIGSPPTSPRPVPSEVLAVNDRLVRERNELREIIDTLWGELPIEIVLRLEAEQPEIVEACKANHEVVAHD